MLHLRFNPFSHLVPIRPAAASSDSSDNVIPATDWRVITQAAPATVPASMPATAYAYSNLVNSYDSTTDGQKTIVKFNEFVLAGPSEAAILTFSDYAVSERIDSILHSSASSFSTTTEIRMRVRPITADFDASALTWNNVVVAPSLTYGTEVTPQMFSEVAVYSADPVPSKSFGFPTAFAIQFVGPLTCYGFIIDIRLVLSVGFTGTALWTCPFGDPHNAPYLLVLD